MPEKYTIPPRQATEEDVIVALQDAYITPPLSEPAELLEFFNRVLDVLGVENDE